MSVLCIPSIWGAGAMLSRGFAEIAAVVNRECPVLNYRTVVCPRTRWRRRIEECNDVRRTNPAMLCRQKLYPDLAPVTAALHEAVYGDGASEARPFSTPPECDRLRCRVEYMYSVLLTNRSPSMARVGERSGGLRVGRRVREGK